MRAKRNGRARFHSCATHLNFIQRSARVCPFVSWRIDPPFSRVALPAPRNLHRELNAIYRSEKEEGNQNPNFSRKVRFKLIRLAVIRAPRPTMRFISDKSKVSFLRERENRAQQLSRLRLCFTSRGCISVARLSLSRDKSFAESRDSLVFFGKVSRRENEKTSEELTTRK